MKTPYIDVLSDDFLLKVEKRIKGNDKRFRKKVKRILKKLNKTTQI